MIMCTILAACFMLCAICGALWADAQPSVKRQPLVAIDKTHLLTTSVGLETELERLFWSDKRCPIYGDSIV